VFSDNEGQFEKELGFRPLLHGPTVEDCFKGWAALGGALVQKFQFPAPDPSVTTQDREITEGLKIRVYVPSSYTGNTPIGLFIHGGGWAMGDLDADDGNCRAISKGSGVVLVSVDYRLAPAHPSPAALDDCVTAFKWILQNAASLGGTIGKAFICGASAGANLAFGTALRLIDEGLGTSIAGVVAQVPVSIHPDLLPEELKSKYTSYDENAEHTVNSKSAMLAFWDAYGSPKDNYANCLLHPKLKDLPKVYISCAGHDTLRDDSRLMKAALEKNGYEEDKTLL
jgi:versiconal hemiacetal acetate esterase